MWPLPPRGGNEFQFKLGHYLFVGGMAAVVAEQEEQ
jgi:hypothetical protein